MIPVQETELIDFDINKEDEKYRQILISQYHFCNKHIDEIMKKANITYTKRVEGKNKFMNKVCCDFKLLEEQCKKYKK